MHENANKKQVIGFEVEPRSGKLSIKAREDAGGSSTCYLTVDQQQHNMLLVNYWDSTMGVMPIGVDGGLKPLRNLQHPERKIKKVTADARAHPHPHPHTHTCVAVG